MYLPTDASANADPYAGAQMMPLPVPRRCLCLSMMMPLNASVDEEYASADALDADVCRCK